MKQSKLDNGLTILSNEMSHLQSAAVGVWVGSGSRAERENQKGISHLLEHMAFKGTQRRSALDISHEIERVGGELNAATGIENTSYYARLLADDLPLAVNLLGDILTGSLFEANELAREKNVIAQEIGMARDNPEDQVFDFIQETAFPDQALGRPIMGTPQSVESFSANDIRTYMAQRYCAPDMVLSAAGGIRHEDLVALGEAAFSALPARNVDTFEPGRYVGGEYRSVRPELMEAQLILGFEGFSYKQKDFYGLQILSTILGGGMSSRLFQELREKRGLCYSIYAFHWGFSDTGLFGIHTATDEESLEELMPVLLSELLRASHDISEDELATARAQSKAGLIMGMESPALCAGHFARQKLIFGAPLPMEEIVCRIEAVSLADLSRLAEALLLGSKPSLAAIGPVKNLMSVDQISARLGQK